jgi:hypothetical protein
LEEVAAVLVGVVAVAAPVPAVVGETRHLPVVAVAVVLETRRRLTVLLLLLLLRSAAHRQQATPLV